MKRKGLVIGATTVALAAVPVIGVTAESSTTEVTDTVTVTVESSCTFAETESEPDPTERAVTLGQGTAAKDIAGAELKVDCTNSQDGAWTVTVQGEDDAKLKKDGSSSDTIASSGATLDGTTSNWAFKLGVVGNAKIEGGYNDYSQVPTTSTKAVSSTSADKAGTAKIQASYGVSVAEDQAAGTYTGRVTYTLTAGGAPQE